MVKIKFRSWNDSEKIMTTPFAWINDSNMFSTKMCSQPTRQLMQFTGRTDVNGCDVYEEDIVEQGSPLKYDSGEFVRGVIKFIDCCFVVTYTHDDGKVYLEALGETFKVVGNTFQNMDLLERVMK